MELKSSLLRNKTECAIPRLRDQILFMFRTRITRPCATTTQPTVIRWKLVAKAEQKQLKQDKSGWGRRASKQKDCCCPVCLSERQDEGFVVVAFLWPLGVAVFSVQEVLQKNLLNGSPDKDSIPRLFQYFSSSLLQ